MNDFIAVLEEQLVTAHRERRPRRRPIPWRGGAIVAAAAVTVAAVIAVVIALASPDAHRAGSGPPQQQQPPAQTTPVHPARRTTVAVLNGTTIVGLARATANKLSASDFRAGVVTNDTTNQHRARTVIYYEPGYKEQGQTVAGCIGSGLDLIRPMTATARVAADRAPIAVFVGADLAQ